MIPLIIWPTVYERFKEQLKEPLMMVTGIVSREEETLLVQVRDVVIPKIPKRDGQGERSHAEALKLPRPMFR